MEHTSSAVLVAAVMLAACSQQGPDANAAAKAVHTLTVHRSASCGCCGKWTSHAKRNGFAVHERLEQDVGATQQQLGVPRHLQACHVAKVGGYLIVGHVPAEDIERLLAEKPAARGLAVAGMPAGSPGMEHPRLQQAFDTMLFQADGQSTVFAHHGD